MAVSEFASWREYLQREPDPADRLEYWLSAQFTAFLNANRKPDSAPYDGDELREGALLLAAGLPDRWEERPPPPGRRLTGKALENWLIAWAGGDDGE
jgi:hypothetical protein